MKKDSKIILPKLYAIEKEEKQKKCETKTVQNQIDRWKRKKSISNYNSRKMMEFFLLQISAYIRLSEDCVKSNKSSS